MSKWKAAAVYLAIWSAGAVLSVVLLPFGWAALCIISLWGWAIFNLIQVARGNRRRLWR